MSKASLLELCHGEKKYKEILFSVPDGGSDEGAEMAANYHSIIRTVKMQGRSAWEYLGKFFTKIFNGCKDFISLRPGNIGLATCQHFR